MTSGLLDLLRKHLNLTNEKATPSVITNRNPPMYDHETSEERAGCQLCVVNVHMYFISRDIICYQMSKFIMRLTHFYPKI